jgi:hypothetical protein
VAFSADYATIELACVLLRSAKLLLERVSQRRGVVHIKFDAGKAIVHVIKHEDHISDADAPAARDDVARARAAREAAEER